MTDDNDLHRYLTVLRKQLPLIVATMLIVAAAAAGAALLQTPRYRATTTLLFTPAAGVAGQGTAEDPQRVLNTIVQVATTDTVLRAAAKASGIRDVSKSVGVVADSSADLVVIAGTGSSPETARRVADGLAQALVAWRRTQQRTSLSARVATLNSQLAQYGGSSSPADVAAAADLRSQLTAARAALATAEGDLALVQAAKRPTAQYSPHPVRDGIIGALVGLLLGIGAAFVRDRLNRRLRTVEDVEAVYGFPTLGVVPRVASAVRERSAGLGDFSGSSALADAYRTVRTNVSLFRLDRDLRVLVVSSAVPGEGKSAATANLAVALASSGKRVLAISADLRAPTLHEYFGERGSEGVLDVLSGEVELGAAAHTVSLDGAVSRTEGMVALLSNEQRFSDPAVLWQSAAMGRLLDLARANYDVVLLDSPPLLASGDASVLTQRADALLLVARVDRLTRDQARRALGQLRAAGSTPLGLIVTGVRADETYGAYG
jgi:capsular exopolysaccharide synthesis family protein